MTSLQEAEALKSKIETILHIFQDRDFECSIHESEVKLRYDTIVNVLLITNNDTSQLLKDWRG
jgi:hypothetical protein